MRFEIVPVRPAAARLVGGLAAALLLPACLAAPPAVAPADGADAAKPARPVRIDAATPFPILTHAPRPEPSGPASAAPPSATPPASAAPPTPAATPAPTLSEILKATALASAPPLPEVDAEAVVAALEDEAVDVLLPASLIHDGGTALYRLAAEEDDDAADAAATDEVAAEAEATGTRPEAGRPSESPSARPSPRASEAPAEPPTAWRRQAVEVGGREAVTARGKRADEAGAVVGFQNRGTFAYRPEGGGEAVRKPFIETFSRQVGLKKGKATWRPDALGPIRIATPGAAGGLEIAAVKLRAPDDASIGFEVGAEDVLTALADLPHAVKGAKLRLEATVRDRQPGGFHVFGRLGGERVLLRDDGTAEGDVAGDGIYVWELTAPTSAGYHHLVIDVLDARCFAPKGAFRAVALGITFEVKK